MCKCKLCLLCNQEQWVKLLQWGEQVWGRQVQTKQDTKYNAKISKKKKLNKTKERNKTKASQSTKILLEKLLVCHFTNI